MVGPCGRRRPREPSWRRTRTGRRRRAARVPVVLRFFVPLVVWAFLRLLGLGAVDAWAGTDSGRAVFETKCAVCHATEPEFHKAGPSLFGVYGRTAGTAPFFAGYRGLKGADWVWDDRTLDAWLADPRGMLGGRDTTMTLHLDDPAQRSAVIAYLKTLR